MSKSGEERGEALLAKVQGLLTAAVVDRNYEEVARLAKLADEIRKLEDQEEKITERRKALAVSLQTSSFANNENELLQESESGESARERGARVRNHFVDGILAQDGIRL